jgi:hypothetical protein
VDSYRNRVRSISSDLASGGGGGGALAAASTAVSGSGGGGSSGDNASLPTAPAERTTPAAGGNVPWSADSAAKLHEITDYRATIANAYEWMW